MNACWILALLISVGYSQWPTAVHSHSFGNSQVVGQAEFPDNVLGPLTAPVGPSVPASTPSQVVSLGKGGFVALTFDPPIINGTGADFIVFENAFNFGSNQVFDEWMTVSVSQDGINWVDFPHNTTTGEGMAGRTPTGDFGVDYTDPTVAGGDAYDLSVVNLDTVNYVRVTDATQHQPADRLSAELDGMVAVHQAEATSRMAIQQRSMRIFQSPSGPLLKLFQPVDELVCFSAKGERIFTLGKMMPGSYPTMQLTPGLYVFKAKQGGHILTAKYIQTL